MYILVSHFMIDRSRTLRDPSSLKPLLLALQCVVVTSKAVSVSPSVVSSCHVCGDGCAVGMHGLLGSLVISRVCSPRRHRHVCCGLLRYRAGESGCGLLRYSAGESGCTVSGCRGK